jgi:hypothetical protein
MYRILAAWALAGAGAASFLAPVHAANSTVHSHSNTSAWSQHDTAVYVVSTLNLLRTHSGRSVASVFAQHNGVTHYDVLGDDRTSSLYFVELKKADGSNFGAYAYQMGWTKPMAVTTSVAHFGVKLASSDVQIAYRADPKELLGTFTSTLPQ